MPVQRCTENGRPGWRYGTTGKCYCFTKGDKAGSNAAKRKAYIQASAIKTSQAKAGKKVK